MNRQADSPGPFYIQGKLLCVVTVIFVGCGVTGRQFISQMSLSLQVPPTTACGGPPPPMGADIRYEQ